MNEIDKTIIINVTKCALHNFAINCMTNNEMETHSLFSYDILEYI